MKEKREQLTAILIQLMDQKKDRQDELTSRLKEMESSRTDENDNYWLIQYQKMLDNEPKVVRNIRSIWNADKLRLIFLYV
jgi:E3 ubiquitin-protein ligase LRSAM1